MSSREVVVLGTGSQVPTRTRNHNAVFLRWDDAGILFDPGEGTQRQLTHAGLSVSQLTHICITHFHGDHCLGLAGIVQRISLDRVQHPIHVVYPASGQVYFDRLRHASIFFDQSQLVPVPIGGDEAVDCGRVGKGSQLVARPLDHGVEAWGYRVQEDDSRRMIPERLVARGVQGPLIRELQRAGEVVVDGRTVRIDEVSDPRPGQSFALVMDTRPCRGAAALARGVDLLVCESTYLDAERREADEHRHMTCAQAATLGRDARARRLVLTHFSQRYTDLGAFRAEAGALHPDVVVAEDLTRVGVPAR